jgi:hypothetical protein
MPPPIQYPLINGVRHDFSSVEAKLAGLVFIGVKSIDYSRTRERGMVQGNHPDPMGKTRGKNTYKATVEVYIAEWNAFQKQLGPGYGDVFFPFLVTYVENGFDTICDEIQGCTMDSTEASMSTGTDPLTRKFELNPLKILFDGIDDLTTPLVGVQT